VVKTDHYNLKYLLDQRLAMIPQHQWVNKLMGFDFSVEYKPNATNTVADALSHREEEEAGELVALAVPTFKMFDDLHAKADEVFDLQQLKKDVVAGERGDKWRVVDGLITVADKVYVPAASPLLPAILAAVHDMGHEGTEKTLNCMCHDFFVPGARPVVQEHVRACEVYQRSKVQNLHPIRMLQPLVMPSAVWAHVSMDFMEGFPRMN
jgi:hypothetical protein